MCIFRHHPVDWEDQQNPLAKKEPRRGRRLTLAATAQCPGGPLVVYSCHLEVHVHISVLSQHSQIKCWQKCVLVSISKEGNSRFSAYGTNI